MLVNLEITKKKTMGKSNWKTTKIDVQKSQIWKELKQDDLRGSTNRTPVEKSIDKISEMDGQKPRIWKRFD